MDAAHRELSLKAQTHRGVIRRRFINVSARRPFYNLAATVHHNTKMTRGPCKGYKHVCVFISAHVCSWFTSSR